MLCRVVWFWLVSMLTAGVLGVVLMWPVEYFPAPVSWVAEVLWLGVLAGSALVTVLSGVLRR